MSLDQMTRMAGSGNPNREKSFVEPLKIILDSIGWKTEHVSSLEDFFG